MWGGGGGGGGGGGVKPLGKYPCASLFPDCAHHLYTSSAISRKLQNAWEQTGVCNKLSLVRWEAWLHLFVWK